MKIGIDIQVVREFMHMEKIFSLYEIDYIKKKGINQPQTATGIYCAKEAFFKALGTGILHSKLPQIEVLHDEHGMPYYKIKDIKLFNQLISETKTPDSVRQSMPVIPTLALSISHTGDLAVAVCVMTWK
ncbi:MAG: 4'-phosphopantetheinyl transferase superfamily protein [Firmicutes bacterium]|nr:4'-phosphopantetheinyl transferase superfamily protein [Bacillota bacterium]